MKADYAYLLDPHETVTDDVSFLPQWLAQVRENGHDLRLAHRRWDGEAWVPVQVVKGEGRDG